MEGRIIHTFDIPSILGSDIKSVGLVELTAAEELMVARRVRADVAKFTAEMAKAALKQVNGSDVSLVDGSLDRTWEGMGPKCRGLVIQAWQKISVPADEEVEDFLGSQKVTTRSPDQMGG